MGTRSLTRIMKPGWHEEGGRDYTKQKCECCIYQQYDGYPDGLGKELADFLKPFTIRNGYSFDDKAGTHANGMGCLAAQMIAMRKTGIGNVYVMHPDTEDVGEDYIYEIREYDGHLYMKVISPGWAEYPTEVLFDGPVERYEEWLKEYLKRRDEE